MPAVEDGDVPMASANLMTLQGLIAKSRIGQGKTNDKNKKKPAATQNGGGKIPGDGDGDGIVGE